MLPETFLPAAERYNLVGRLDRWVLVNALEWLAKGLVRHDEIEFCAVNLSGQTLGEDAFLSYVDDQFNRTGVPGERVCFEITETAAVADLASATRFLSTLKRRGCRFALDDFGSGLSSFAYLKSLQVDYLKIDGVFVKDIDDDAIDLAMVKSINEVGQLMGMQTIAEFVESFAILDKLRGLGVNYAQGYALGRPFPLAPASAPD